MLEIYEELDEDMLQAIRLTMVYNVVIESGGEYQAALDKVQTTWEFQVMSEVMSEY